MKRPSWALAGAMCAGLLCFQAPVMAQSTTQTPALTEAQVTAKLQAAGYTNVHSVEHEGDHFDADAQKNGQTLHLHIDAKTGAITTAQNENENEENEYDNH